MLVRVLVSQPTAWRDIKDLLTKGVLTRRGQGKKTSYRLGGPAPGELSP